MSIMLADIDATCASLGFYDGENYIPEPDALQGLKVRSICFFFVDFSSFLSFESWILCYFAAFSVDFASRRWHARVSASHGLRQGVTNRFVANVDASNWRRRAVGRVAATIGEFNKSNIATVQRSDAKGWSKPTEFLALGRDLAIVQSSLFFTTRLDRIGQASSKSIGNRK